MEKLRTEHVIGCSVNTKGQERPQTTRKGILLNRAYAMVTGGEFEDYRLMRLRIPLDPSEGVRNDASGQPKHMLSSLKIIIVLLYSIELLVLLNPVFNSVTGA